MADLVMVKLFGTLLTLILTLLQLKYDGANKNMFENHPNLSKAAVISLLVFSFLLLIKLKYTGHYERYLGRSAPIVEAFFGSLSMASVVSLLLPGYVTPHVFIVCLIIPVAKSLYWVFAKMEECFGDTEFWMGRVEPTLYHLRRRANRVRIWINNRVIRRNYVLPL